VKKKFPKKKIVLIVVAVVLVGTAAVQMLKPKTAPAMLQRATPLEVMDLASTVDVTGTVASGEKVTVHSTLGEPVTEIAVKVGDRVEEGQLLCKLDTAAIESDITARQAVIATTAQQNQLRLQQAKTDLYYAEWYRDHQQDAGILSAQQAVEEAQRAVESAKYDIRSAEDNYDEARSENRKADAEIYSDYQMNQLRDAVSAAYLRLEGAEANLKAAKQRLNRAKWDAEARIKELQRAVTSAETAADLTTEYIALEKLKDNLANCIINAPASGTVTAVYAKEGAEAKGLLFVIEDTQDLIIETAIKELDVNAVQPGMPVQIKSDATGNEIFEGEVLSIDPASRKDASGETVTGSTAEYAAKVRVTTQNSGLKIGMNARVSILLEQRKQTMAVLFDSVGTDAEGNSIVYVARPQEDGSYLAQAVVVETGLETDLYLEVSGELSPGDLILQNPANLYDGMVVQLAPEIMGNAMGGSGITVTVG
jgi:HlyD family secretion protein